MNYSFGDTILKAENISLYLGEDSERKLILRDVNVEVKDILVPGKVRGQVIGFLGPSGRGKTQLFKILAGLNKPTTGTVTLGDPTKGNSKEVKAGDVGVVYQSYPLFEHRTVISNLQMVMTGKKMTEQEAADKIDFYLDRFKMIEHKTKYPAQLSGGQRQRIAIIQQMLCSEYFILMDEPFSGLDPLMTTEVCAIIQEIADLDEKNTIIIVSHDIYSTASVSSVLWMLGYDYETVTPVREDVQKQLEEKAKNKISVMNGYLMFWKNDERRKKYVDEHIENACATKRVPIPGARIKYVENLMDRGLAWKENLTESPEFFDLIKDLRKAYNDL